MTPLGTAINNLRQSIHEIANPENDTEGKFDSVEAALSDIHDALEHLMDCFQQLGR